LWIKSVIKDPLVKKRHHVIERKRNRQSAEAGDVGDCRNHAGAGKLPEENESAALSVTTNKRDSSTP
jgi:hypothetical protein